MLNIYSFARQNYRVESWQVLRVPMSGLASTSQLQLEFNEPNQAAAGQPSIGIKPQPVLTY